MRCWQSGCRLAPERPMGLSDNDFGALMFHNTTRANARDTTLLGLSNWGRANQGDTLFREQSMPPKFRYFLKL